MSTVRNSDWVEAPAPPEGRGIVGSAAAVCYGIRLRARGLTMNSPSRLLDSRIVPLAK